MGGGGTKFLGKILTFQNWLKLGMQTRSKPASHLQVLDCKVKLSQSLLTLGGGGQSPWGKSLGILELAKTWRADSQQA